MFTGEVEQAGSWVGVRVLSTAASAELQHLTVEYAGQPPAPGHDSAGIFLEAVPKATLYDVTVRDCSGTGLDLYLYYSTVVVRHSVFTSNGAWPVDAGGVSENLGAVIDATSTFLGNGSDCVRLSGQMTGLAQLDVPYCE